MTERGSLPGLADALFTPLQQRVHVLLFGQPERRFLIGPYGVRNMSAMSSRPTPPMKRTTVMLPAELRRRAFIRARERGVSLGELIRESLESALPTAAPARADDALFADSAVFAGKAPTDLSAAHDRYLYGEDA